MGGDGRTEKFGWWFQVKEIGPQWTMCEQEGAENWDSEWKPMGKQIMLKSSVVPGQTHPWKNRHWLLFLHLPLLKVLFRKERRGREG